MADLCYFRQYGAGALGGRYHGALVGSVNASIATFAADTLYCSPVVLAAGGTVVRLFVAHLASGSARLGLYANTADANLRPGVLIVDGGTVTSGGNHFATVNKAVNAGLYWIGLIYSSTQAAADSLPVTGNAPVPILGYDANLGTMYHGWSAARSFATGFPPSFPTSGARATSMPFLLLGLGV